MADFSALIAQIEAYVKQNGNNEITGNGLQDILVGMVNALGTVAITALQGDLEDEETARTNADSAINAKIPAEASSSNQLADKAFVTGLTTPLQNAVNAIKANIDNGYVYAGIAIPSGTPVSGKVFYLARQAGTYTNFGGLTLTEGVNVLKYNGTTWSQEQLISIADIYKNPLMGYYECDTTGATAAKTVAATGYVLPTTGGSVKIKMANRNTVANATLNINSTGAKPLFYNGQRAGVGNTWDTNEIVEVFYDGTNYQAYNVAGSNGDGVFDISAYNPTNGQPTPYVDLTAALGTDGEHVPQSLRKGGMSVKFIKGSAQSSDNKYVQFRLMAQSFTTDETQWQGVDDEPVEQSHNLPESWGILQRILFESKYQEDVLDKVGNWTIRQDYTDKVGYSGDGHNGIITAISGGDLSAAARPYFDISQLDNDSYYIFSANIYSQNSLGDVRFGWNIAQTGSFKYLKNINGEDVKVPSGVSQTVNVVFKKISGNNVIYTTVSTFAAGETISISDFSFKKLATFVFDDEPIESNDAPHVLSSKAAYNAVNSVGLNRLSLKGNDFTYAVNKYWLPLIDGHLYRINLANTLDLSTIMEDARVLGFAYMSKTSGSYVYLSSVDKDRYSTSLKYIYFLFNGDIDDVDWFLFVGRFKKDTILEATIEDVTDEFSLDSTNWDRAFTPSDKPLFEGRIYSGFHGNDTLIGNVYNIVYKVNDFIHINANVPNGYKIMTAIHPTFVRAIDNTSGTGRHAFGCGYNNDPDKYSQYRWGDSDYKNGFLMIRVAKNDETIITDEELAEIKSGLNYEFYPLSSYGESIKHEHQIASINGKSLTNDDFEFFGTQRTGGRVDDAPARIKYLYQYISGSYIVNVDFDAAKLLIPTLQVVIQTCNTLEGATRNQAKEALTNNWVPDNQSVSFSDNSEVILSISFRKSDNSTFSPSEMATIQENVRISVRSNAASNEENLMIFDVENASTTVVQSSSIISVPHRGIKYNVKLPSGIKARFAYGTSSISSYTGWVEGNAFLTIPADNYLHRLQISNSDDSAISANDVSILLKKGDINISYKKTDALNIKERNYESEKYIKAAFMRMNYNDSQDAAQHGGFESMPIIAHTSDLHGDIQRFSNFIEYIKLLNVNVDAAVVSGDSVYLNSQNGSKYLKDVIDGLNGHKIIHCIGNHESYQLPDGTVDRNAYLFTNHIQPFADNYKSDASTDATMPYYYRDYAEKNIRMIAINQYDNGCYYGAGLGGRFGQTQVTWICNTLLSIPADYGVVIVMHSPEAKVNTPQNMMAWNQTVYYDGTAEDESGYAVNGLYVNVSRPLRTIIDAFISKQHLETSYTENTRDFNNGETVNIDVDFTQLNEGVEFICYMTGHRHIDNIGYVDGATNMQLMLNIVTGNCNYPHIGNTARDADLCDIPRGNYGSTQDAFNVYAIDRKAGNVKIARVGSNVNFEGIERKFLIAPYRNSNS